MTDPRLDHLTALVDTLISEHIEATGRPPATAAEIRAELAAVAADLDRDRRRAAHASAQATRTAYHRGRGSRR
ncbi:hypothetical protein [Streptomyces griseus]|uniref:hypothetical protein n=1 Tax=Streptomyces griseus TaxID=1911 RepID=UPI0005660138|nr:hypothetical protein [Streptomyces griseus]